MGVSAIIVAGGTGSRFGGKTPKQYLDLRERPIISYALEAFERCNSVDDVVIVAASSWHEFISESVVRRFAFRKISAIIGAGNSRQGSVLAGLEALRNTEVIVVHDAVRPFVTGDQIDEVVKAARLHKAAILAVPVRDTIKEGAGGFVRHTLQRERLWAAQTPQAFDAQLLLQAHRAAREKQLVQTDDAALVEALGVRVKIVEGAYSNIKITEPIDVALAQLILQKSV